MSMESGRFRGRRVLITGAGRGLGRQIALAFANEGASVVALSKSKENVERFKHLGLDIEPVACDISNPQEVTKVLDLLGDFDCLVNNAGVYLNKPMLDVSVEDFDYLMGVNIRGAFLVSQCVAKKMVACGRGGAIVSVSSIVGKRGFPGFSIYSMSKAALEQMTMSMAAELGRHQIRVNCVCPTLIMNEQGKIPWKDPLEARPILSRTPLQRFAEFEDVIQAIFYLVSDQAKMINGVVLPVDGGYLATGN